MRSRRAHTAPSHWRFYMVACCLCLMLLALIGRVLSLQVLDLQRGREFLQGQGDARAVRTAEIPAYRGVISDRRGEPLAVSTPVVSLWADPRTLAGSERLDELASALAMDPGELRARLAQYEGRRFMYLVRHLKPVDARAVLDRRIAGVHSEREYRRFYPASAVTAQLIGLTNVDGEGVSGIELLYNNWLQGEPGKKQYIKDLHGEVARDIGVLTPPRSGRDLALSIDLRLQYLQQRELQRAVQELDADSGTVVTLDCHTGEVLAVVNYPAFNPNSRQATDPASMRNRALTDVYEPGSTMKTLTLVAALESGRFTLDTVIDTTPGAIRVGRKTYRDPNNYGPSTLTRVLQKSSQVGVTKLALDLGPEPIREVFDRFGIGHAPGTGFPGERAGELPARTRWALSEQVSLAFGYGITASPLQLASAYTVFANDGVRPPVSLLALEGEAPAGERVVSPVVARQVLKVLNAITFDDGTARRARVPGYAVGGKTGTVHKVGPGGYQDKQYVALFAGVAPVDDPRLVTVVVINEPKGERYGGGSAAAPVFSAVMQGALRLLNVAPTPVAAGEPPVASKAAPPAVAARPGRAA